MSPEDITCDSPGGAGTLPQPSTHGYEGARALAGEEGYWWQVGKKGTHRSPHRYTMYSARRGIQFVGQWPSNISTVTPFLLFKEKLV